MKYNKISKTTTLFAILSQLYAQPVSANDHRYESEIVEQVLKENGNPEIFAKESLEDNKVYMIVKYTDINELEEMFTKGNITTNNSNIYSTTFDAIFSTEMKNCFYQKEQQIPSYQISLLEIDIPNRDFTRVLDFNENLIADLSGNYQFHEADSYKEQ